MIHSPPEAVVEAHLSVAAEVPGVEEVAKGVVPDAHGGVGIHDTGVSACSIRHCRLPDCMHTDHPVEDHDCHREEFEDDGREDNNSVEVDIDHCSELAMWDIGNADDGDDPRVADAQVEPAAVVDSHFGCVWGVTPNMARADTENDDCHRKDPSGNSWETWNVDVGSPSLPRVPQHLSDQICSSNEGESPNLELP